MNAVLAIVRILLPHVFIGSGSGMESI